MAVRRHVPNTFAPQNKRNTGMDSHQNNVIMQVVKCMPAVTTFPTGDKSFAVQQGFPQPISAEEADPFLMCDHFVRNAPPPSFPPFRLLRGCFVACGVRACPSGTIVAAEKVVGRRRVPCGLASAQG